MPEQSQAQHVDYDQIAPEYNQRYSSSEPESRGQALLELARGLKPGRVLEAGCGTGHWLAALRSITDQVFGLDFSLGMLGQARAAGVRLKLTRGTALRLPFSDREFSLVYCVDALHHFGDPPAFIAEAARVLCPRGVLAIFTNDPHGAQDSWYAYHYFDGMYATDLLRFPPRERLAAWLQAQGFEDVETRLIQQVDSPKHGRAVLDDPFLRKNASSQLALLNPEAYRDGLQRIRADLAEAERRGETLVFRSTWTVHLIAGRRPN
jgi:SAM-dependent methyltransferase